MPFFYLLSDLKGDIRKYIFLIRKIQSLKLTGCSLEIKINFSLTKRLLLLEEIQIFFQTLKNQPNLTSFKIAWHRTVKRFNCRIKFVNIFNASINQIRKINQIKSSNQLYHQSNHQNHYYNQYLY